MRRRRVDEPMKGVEKPTVRCPLAPQKVIAKGGAPLRSSGHVVARYRALPNESRLSCGAELEGSQGEFYHTARKTFSGSIGGGRRQLQALVRLRTIDHSSGPFSPGAERSTHRRIPPMGIVRPNGRLLGTRRARRAPSATGPSFGKRFGIERTTPTDAGFRLRADHVGVHKKTWFWESCAA